MQWQVIHNQVDPFLWWIGSAQCAESCQEVSNGLPFVNCACQTVLVHIIKTEELLGPSESPVCGRQSLGMSSSGPVLSMNRSDLQRSPLVKTHRNGVTWRPTVEFKNEVFFSRTPDRETVVSTSWFSEARDLRASGVCGSTRC